MGRAETVTKLPLARFAKILGINPLHFEGVQLDGSAGLPNLQQTTCETAWPQFEWQDSDRVSREELARAIRRAEDDIERYIGYRLAPTWEVDERHTLPTTHRPELVNYTFRNQRWYALSVQASWGRFISGGLRAKTVIQAAAAIVWSDSDGDSYKETATVTVASTVTPCEVHAYFPGHSGGDTWEIRPITVTAAGGNLTITFRRELVVDSDLAEALEWGAVDGSVDANFLSTVDVYRIYNDGSQMATLVWENLQDLDTLTSVAVGQEVQQAAVLHARNPDLGLIAYEPATYDATTGDYEAVAMAVQRQPDSIRLWYRAGLRDQTLDCPDRDMSSEWERTVAYYAAALLERCPCDCSVRWFEHWQTDRAFSGGADQTGRWNIPSRLLDNPFGTRRGAVYAWQRVEALGSSIAGTVLA